VGGGVGAALGEALRQPGDAVTPAGRRPVAEHPQRLDAQLRVRLAAGGELRQCDGVVGAAEAEVRVQRPVADALVQVRLLGQRGELRQCVVD